MKDHKEAEDKRKRDEDQRLQDEREEAERLENLRKFEEEEEKRKKEDLARLESEKEERLRNTAINLCIGAYVWCSGIFDPMGSGEFGPEKAIDGNPNSRWCGHPPETAWIALDFGSEKELTKVKIRFERAFAAEYKIDIAEDTTQLNDSWFTVVERKDGKQGWNEITLERPLARYFRLVETKAPVEGWGMSIWELEVYGLAPRGNK